MPCEAAPSDRRMDSAGRRSGALARARWHRDARPQARERPDRDRGRRARVAVLTRPGGRGGGRARVAVLQPGAGKVQGRYVRSTPETAHWGGLPGRESVPAATVDSGALVTIDTVSHEGILEDQGRDPVAFFARHGIPAGKVLDDAKAIAASSLATRRPVRGQRPGRRARRRAGRHPEGRRAGARPARRATASSPTATPRARATTSRRSRPCTASRPDTACSCAPGSRSTPAWGSSASPATTLTAADGLGVGSSLYLPVLTPGREVLRRRPALRAGRRGRARGAAAGELPAHRAGPRQGAAGDRARRVLGRAWARGRARPRGRSASRWPT